VGVASGAVRSDIGEEEKPFRDLRAMIQHTCLG